MPRRKKLLLSLAVTILLAGVCSAAVVPPLGSKFSLWEPIGAEAVFPTRAGVTLRLDHIEERGPSSTGKTWTAITYEMENSEPEPFEYEKFYYALQYQHYGRWYTVFLCIPTMEGGGRIYNCPGSGAILEEALVPAQDLRQKGSYRLYIGDVGFLPLTV